MGELGCQDEAAGLLRTIIEKRAFMPSVLLRTVEVLGELGFREEAAATIRASAVSGDFSTSELQQGAFMLVKWGLVREAREVLGATWSTPRGGSDFQIEELAHYVLDRRWRSDSDVRQRAYVTAMISGIEPLYRNPSLSSEMRTRLISVLRQLFRELHRVRWTMD